MSLDPTDRRTSPPTVEPPPEAQLQSRVDAACGQARPVVLNLLRSAWPGNEATGPNQSLVALATLCAPSFDFRIVARPGRAGREPTPGRGWASLPYGRVCYLTIGRLGAIGLRRLLCETPHDVLMLNGFFDREFTIPALVLRRAGSIPRRPTILSPRGEFAPAALAHSARRKRAYLGLVRRLGLLDGVWLHATAEHEQADMLQQGFPGSRIVFAPDTRLLPPAPARRIDDATDGSLRLVFGGRLTPMKNIDFALRVLARVTCPVRFDLYGPVADAEYWRDCGNLMSRLPAHVVVRHMGAVGHEELIGLLAGYDLFFMPSRGENFGHAIFEALAAGLPVLTSDRTPWQDLAAARAGWSLGLDDPAAFAAVIECVATMSRSERSALRQSARGHAERNFADSRIREQNEAMLRKVMAEGWRP